MQNDNPSLGVIDIQEKSELAMEIMNVKDVNDKEIDLEHSVTFLGEIRPE